MRVLHSSGLDWINTPSSNREDEQKKCSEDCLVHVSSLSESQLTTRFYTAYLESLGRVSNLLSSEKF